MKLALSVYPEGTMTDAILARQLARRIDAAMSRRDRKWIDAIRRFAGEGAASNIIDRVMNDRKVVKFGKSDVTIYTARDAKARKR